MGGLFSRPDDDDDDDFTLGESAAMSPSTAELDGEQAACVALGADACRGLVESAAQLRGLCDPAAEVKLSHGDWWMVHAYHAAFCVVVRGGGGDTEYTRAALCGLRRWQQFAQTKQRLSRYPF